MIIDPAFVAGIVLLLAGWLAVPLAVRVLGLVFGAVTGILLTDLSILAFPDFHPRIWSFVVLGIAAGLIGMVVATKTLEAFFFLAGFFAALVLKLRLDQAYGFSDSLSGGFWGEFPHTIWFTLLTALLGGLLLGFLRRYLIILLSALAGSSMIAERAALQEKWFTIALVGVTFQTLCASAFSRRKSPSKR